MWLKYAKILVSEYAPSWERERVPSYRVRPRDVDPAPDESAFQLLPKAQEIPTPDFTRMIATNLIDELPAPIVGRYANGFLNPEGLFYPVPWTGHATFTRQALWDTGYKGSLEGLGWASIHEGDWIADHKLTEQQKKAILQWIDTCNDKYDREWALKFVEEKS